MKFSKIVLFIFFLLGVTAPTNAQIWKKLKKKAQEKINKVEDKILNKIDEEADKKIEETIDGKVKEESNVKKLKSYGSATINHSTLYGVFKVDDLTKTTVNKEGNKVEIIGYWRSHNADVFDGYKLTIHHLDDIHELQNKTYSIPADATLKLAYNALLKGPYSYETNKVLAPQILELKNGNVTITFNKDKNIAINFTGNVNLSDHKTDKKMNHNTPASIHGMVNTTSPEFTITKVRTHSVKKEAAYNDLSEADKAFLNEKLSPTVNIPSSFSFNKRIKVEIANENGEKHPLEFLLGSYPDIYGMSIASKEMDEQGEVIVVMTPKTSTMFMNVAGMKLKRSTSLEQMGKQYNIADRIPEDGDFEYKKTGRSKIIAGYNCEEYKVDYDYTNAKGSASFWVSKDFPVQNIEMPMLGMKMNNPYLKGFVLEMNSTYEGQNWTITVTEVSDENSTINTAEYKKMGF